MELGEGERRAEDSETALRLHVSTCAGEGGARRVEATVSSGPLKLAEEPAGFMILREPWAACRRPCPRPTPPGLASTPAPQGRGLAMPT